MSDLKEKIKRITEENQIKKTELCRYAGLNQRYYHLSKIKPFLLFKQ